MVKAILNVRCESKNLIAVISTRSMKQACSTGMLALRMGDILLCIILFSSLWRTILDDVAFESLLTYLGFIIASIQAIFKVS